MGARRLTDVYVEIELPKSPKSRTRPPRAVSMFMAHLAVYRQVWESPRVRNFLDELDLKRDAGSTRPMRVLRSA